MTDRVLVLGAADPEMAAIERLLTECGERFAIAVGADGQRVIPRTAYEAVGAVMPDGSPVDPASITHVVECSIDGADHATVIDHHRPGDPGYGRPPEEFLPASSIGQVWALLADRSPVDAPVPQEIVLVAAADHCLEAAYRGRCPGVDPDELMRWRVTSRAAHQERPDACRRCGDVRAFPGSWPGERDLDGEGNAIVGGVGPCGDLHDWMTGEEQILADIERARQRLRDDCRGRGAKLADCGGYCEAPFTLGATVCAQGGCSWGDADYADLRGEHIPELPEAAAREGIPFLASVKERDGREKVVLQAAPPALVERFMAGTLVPGLIDVYGDPARGFAGGYPTASAVRNKGA